ncbi:hypothetical protein IID24_00330 [Patescibacteria group bacterium]|nr:hypothetical protein [Patescibacteria group bacterium]
MWILIALVAYLLFAVSNLLDKYLLVGPIPNSKVYAFYVGMFGTVTFVLIPWFLEFPGIVMVTLGLVAGVVNIFALFGLFTALRKFEASRIIPAMGGLMPIFTAILTFFLAGHINLFVGTNLLAFGLLVGGTVGVALERRINITVESLLYAAVSAFLFSTFFVLSKFTFAVQNFFSAVIWLDIGFVIAALFFLLAPEVRNEVKEKFLRRRKKAESEQPKKLRIGKTAILFVVNQIIGGLGGLLQHYAVFLVPFGLLAFVSAMSGVQYLALFLIALFLSIKFPHIMKERVSRGIIVQKVTFIFVIGTGLWVLTFL